MRERSGMVKPPATPPAAGPKGAPGAAELMAFGLGGAG